MNRIMNKNKYGTGSSCKNLLGHWPGTWNFTGSPDPADPPLTTALIVDIQNLPKSVIWSVVLKNQVLFSNVVEIFEFYQFGKKSLIMKNSASASCSL